MPYSGDIDQTLQLFDCLLSLLVAASSSLDSHIRLWDLEVGQQMRSIDAGPGNLYIHLNVYEDIYTL